MNPIYVVQRYILRRTEPPALAFPWFCFDNRAKAQSSSFESFQRFAVPIAHKFDPQPLEYEICIEDISCDAALEKNRSLFIEMSTQNSAPSNHIDPEYILQNDNTPYVISP
jgi:hypothetical protein